MFLLVETCRKYLKGGFWRSCKQRWHHYPTLIRAWISEWMYQFTGNSQVTLWVSVWILNVSICLKMLPPWPHQNRIIIKSSAQILFLIKKGNAKECLKYLTVALISYASKVMLKILQSGFSNMWTMKFQLFKLVLEKAEEPEIELPTSAGSWKKQESSRKTSISALLTMPKPLTVWITINCGKFWKRWKYQATWLAAWETYMQVRKQQLELDMEQQTGSKSGKE